MKNRIFLLGIMAMFFLASCSKQIEEVISPAQLQMDNVSTYKAQMFQVTAGRQIRTIKSIVIDLIYENHGNDYTDILPNRNLIVDLQFDELDLIELFNSMEVEFQMDIPDYDREVLLTVGDLIDYAIEHNNAWIPDSQCRVDLLDLNDVVHGLPISYTTLSDSGNVRTVKVNAILTTDGGTWAANCTMIGTQLKNASLPTGQQWRWQTLAIQNINVTGTPPNDISVNVSYSNLNFYIGTAPASDKFSLQLNLTFSKTCSGFLDAFTRDFHWYSASLPSN